jgi:predicted DNA-binding protein (MmcQ/YjbR family)
MNLETLRAYCLRKPGKVSEDLPFGPEVLVFRAGGKIFLLALIQNVPLEVNLKCEPGLALELRDRYDAVPDSEVLKMVDHSFELVAGSVPKKYAAKAGAAKPRPARRKSPRK